jgi:hypothetical protein
MYFPTSLEEYNNTDKVGQSLVHHVKNPADCLLKLLTITVKTLVCRQGCSTVFCVFHKVKISFRKYQASSNSDVT